MPTPLRIIDNKRMKLSDSEWALYQEICKSYNRPNFNGKDLFKGLFETNEDGIIIFLRPPTSAYTSMEVYMFLITVMVHQHIGGACDEAATLFLDLKTKFNEAANILNSEIEELKELKIEIQETLNEIKNIRQNDKSALEQDIEQDKEIENLRKEQANARKEEKMIARRTKYVE